jgi:ParB family chromosome partitioning protein
LSLPPKVLELVRDGSLSFGHARALVTHSNPEAGARRIVKDNLTVRQTEEMVNNLGRTFTGKLLTSPPPTRTDSETEALANSLSEKLGLKVKVTFNGKNGSIIMNYKTLDQLDEILALLNR